MSDNEELTRLRRENEYLKNEVVELSRYKLRHILCGMREWMEPTFDYRQN